MKIKEVIKSVIILFLFILFFINKLVFSEQFIFSPNQLCGNGSQTVATSPKQIQESREIEINRKRYLPYTCPNFKVGDKVVYSIDYLIFKQSDFVGVITKVEPKPTTEYIHLITVKRISGKGESGIYSEQFLSKIIN